MESNNVQNHVGDEDRLSKLPDDILLDILGKGSIQTCIRASFLSTRWSHLPSLLSHVSLDISDFVRFADYLNPKAIDKAMANMTKIARISLAVSGRKSTMKAIWMLPEGQKLHNLFNNLSKLFIHGIYVKFGLSWTLTLLEAAPFLKTFGIKVSDHVCVEENRRLYPKRINTWQKNTKLNSSSHSHLTRLEFGGFMAVKKHLQFVRAVMDYASSLETIFLEDQDPCEYCDEVNSNLAYSRTCSTFRKNKCEQEMTRNQLGVGVSCSVQLIFK
ncbi:unnamed protein product [Urochloa decumbens]|uniref:F-box domain-containing protein n=1 Tax=Urochloa decumbens TaxID=240449 RepID=A0ABC8X9A2_9POAL